MGFFWGLLALVGALVPGSWGRAGSGCFVPHVSLRPLYEVMPMGARRGDCLPAAVATGQGVGLNCCLCGASVSPSVK